MLVFRAAVTGTSHGIVGARVDSRTKLNVGLIGLGRLGRVYARDLATRIPCTRLTAVADVDGAAVDKVAREFGVERSSTDPSDVFRDPSVDAVVIVTPTSTHRAMVEGAVAAGKAIFCEKPLSISLDEATAIRRAVEASGAFFQMGFMRRFDRGFAAAKQRLEEGDHRRRRRVQVDVARSVPAVGRVRRPAEQRRPHPRHGHSRLRPRALVHGRSRRRPGDRRPARVSRARQRRRHRQRGHQPDLRERPARRHRYHAQRDLRLRHHGGAARHEGHAAHRLSPRDAADGDDEGAGRARHGAVFHGAVRRRLHRAARELRAERAGRSQAADHRGRWRGGVESGDWRRRGRRRAAQRVEIASIVDAQPA